ncbi:hypothetical protein COOONC_23586 [Cooperia oncophora]
MRYEVNDKVLCKHGLFFYEAKITDVVEEDGELMYTVHYLGWHKRYDERIRHSKCHGMFLPLTEANIAKAKADIQEASTAKIKRKKEKMEGDYARKSEDGSRASTSSPGATVLASPGSDINALDEMLSDLPESLKKILVEDYYAVVVHGKLAVLPARVNVYNIVEKYLDFSKKLFPQNTEIDVQHEFGTTRIASVDTLCASALNLRDYFDLILGYQLLYKYEKPQYEALARREQEKLDGEWWKKHKDFLKGQGAWARNATPLDLLQTEHGPCPPKFRPSKFYGLCHLLRLLVKVPILLRPRWTWTDDHELMTRAASILDFKAFLRQNAPFILDFNRDYKVASADYVKSVG